MLEVGWSEILVIAVVLIVVVGPKDLPPMLRAFGKMTTKLRAMAGQFQTQFSEALKEADLDDVRKTIQDAQKLNPLNTLREAITPIQQMGNELKADLQKSVATPGPNPTVFPAASETADPVVADTGAAETQEEPVVSPVLPSAASAAVPAKPVVADTPVSIPVSSASPSAPVATAAVPATANAYKKPKKSSKTKDTNSEAALKPVVAADEPPQKAKRASKTKAAELPVAVLVAADEQTKAKKKKTAKNGTPEGDA